MLLSSGKSDWKFKEGDWRYKRTILDKMEINPTTNMRMQILLYLNDEEDEYSNQSTLWLILRDNMVVYIFWITLCSHSRNSKKSHYHQKEITNKRPMCLNILFIMFSFSFGLVLMFS